MSVWINRIYTLILSGTLLLMAGCEDNTDSADDIVDNNKNLRDAYISVVINTQTIPVLHSAPSGGENGDGNEDGLVNEDKVNDLMLVLFEGSDLNSALNTPAADVIYVGAGDILPGNVTKVQKTNLEKKVYNLLVLVNVGDLTSQLSSMTVKEICDLFQKTAWTISGTTYSNFKMSSANQATIDLRNATTMNSPAVANVDVQRIAACVDVVPLQGNNSTNTYSILDDTNNIIANITINRVRLVNRLNAGSFTIKRTATTASGAPEYLGKETPDSGNQTNYVIDPWTALKTKANLSGNNFNINSGGAGSSPAKDLYADYFTGISFSNTDNIKAPLTDKDFYILGYTMENTMDKDNQLNGYSTGVVYETTYIPAKITNYNSSSFTNEEINDNQYVTFFVINNNKSIHNSLESVEFAFANGGQSDDMFARQFNTGNTWQQVKDYSLRIKDNDMLGFKAYLNTLLEGKVLSSNLNQNVSWAAYVLDNFGYSRNGDNTVFNQGGKNTISLLSTAGVRAYDNGLCYYPY